MIGSHLKSTGFEFDFDATARKWQNLLADCDLVEKELNSPRLLEALSQALTKIGLDHQVPAAIGEKVVREILCEGPVEVGISADATRYLELKAAPMPSPVPRSVAGARPEPCGPLDPRTTNGTAQCPAPQHA